MKKIYILVPVLFFAFIIKAQNPITNPDFETWNGNVATGWSSASWISKSTTAHTGTYALKGEKLSASPDPSVSSNPYKFSTNTRWGYLNFYYIFSPVANDYLKLNIFLYSGNTAIGQIDTTIHTGTSVYKGVSMPFAYSSSVFPTTCSIAIAMWTNGTLGGYYIIDDISLTSTPLAVEEIEKESASLHVFPNPATNFVQLNFSNDKGKETTIQVSTLLGQIIMELKTTNNQTSFDVSQLPAGNYIVVVKNEEAILTKQLIIE